MYLHYILGLVCIVLGIMHAILMHYDYKDSNYFDGIENEVEWADQVVKNEIFKFLKLVFLINLVGSFMYKNIEPLSYEIFM